MHTKTHEINSDSPDPVLCLLRIIAACRARREQAEQGTLEQSLSRFRELTEAPERRRLVALHLAEVLTDD